MDLNQQKTLDTKHLLKKASRGKQSGSDSTKKKKTATPAIKQTSLKTDGRLTVATTNQLQSLALTMYVHGNGSLYTFNVPTATEQDKEWLSSIACTLCETMEKRSLQTLTLTIEKFGKLRIG